MKRLLMALALLITGFIARPQSLPNYLSYPEYQGNDLGLVYSKNNSSFRIWSPAAEKVELLLYANGFGGLPIQNVTMVRDKSGTWVANLDGDQQGKFYVFKVQIAGKWSKEVPDPYAKAVGINGIRAMVVDLSNTQPTGWESDQRLAATRPTESIIYELHVRDASIAANSGIVKKGKFVGLTEKNTRNTSGLSTGLDHLKELGVTHIHLLPSYDFNSVDESAPDKKYNWGYDPLNYNTPEGSFATNAYDGVTRIKEFKQLIQTFHANGLKVVMDVVYNHTALTQDSYFNELVPGYYYRQNKEGGFSNATACGNETASERPMVRKFILESMKYWLQEYHIDGFRVDLMGVHDIETMNSISEELHRIYPGVLIYGEGWTAGSSPLPDSLRALKKNVSHLDRIAVFSDDIRDGIKGSVFEHQDRGFATGKAGMEESVKFGIVASCQHPQIDYTKVNYSKAPYSKQPYQTVTYTECHDNHVLWDKINISTPGATEQERRNMHQLAISIVLTSQGISFLHAGTEFLRTKKGVENSFESSDSINAIDWDLKSKNKSIVDYVSALIQIRKAHPAFRMETAQQIRDNLRFFTTPAGTIGYMINGGAVNDSWKKICVLFNGTNQTQQLSIDKQYWQTAIRDNKIVPEITSSQQSKIKLAPYSCTLLYMDK